MKRKLRYQRLIWSHIFLLIIGIILGFGITQYSFDDNTRLIVDNGNSEFGENIMVQSPDHLRGSAYIAAVSNKNEGLIGEVNVDISDGSGLILINTNPFLEPDTQFSANVAVGIAEKVTGKSLDEKNVILDFDVNGTVLGGPSAGAAMTLATIAAIEGKELNNVVVTGTILPSGVIGPVGGILEKGQAASEEGADLFLVPQGQSTFTYYEKQIEEQPSRGMLRIFNTFLVPKTVDLARYFKEEHGLDIVEIATIRDAMDYAFD